MFFDDVGDLRKWWIKAEFTRGPGSSDTCRLSFLDETFPDWKYYPSFVIFPFSLDFVEISQASRPAWPVGAGHSWDQEKSTWRAKFVNSVTTYVRPIKAVGWVYSTVSREYISIIVRRSTSDKVATLPGFDHAINRGGDREKDRKQNKLKVLKLTHESTETITGSKLIKPIQRQRKLLESKLKECH